MIVSRTGETEALVHKGKVGIRSGSDPVRSRTSTILMEGQAGAVDAGGNMIARRYLPSQIVREMPEDPSFGIPGRRLDLADVIAGGNGFGTGNPTSAINPVSGRYVLPVESDRRGMRQYALVPWNRYVDGVFVPDGTGPQIISSAGHTFVECPTTNNIYYIDITNVGDAQVSRQMLGGHAYGSPDRPCNADFRVLVDGRVRFSRTGVKIKGIAGQIDVELGDADRFLTLITTDGGDADVAGGLRGTDSDWCVFVEPNLELAPLTGTAVDVPTVSEL